MKVTLKSRKHGYTDKIYGHCKMTPRIFWFERLFSVANGLKQVNNGNMVKTIPWLASYGTLCT